MKIEECYQLGRLTKAWGYKGQVVLFLDVDTPEDYDVVSSVYGALYHSNPRFSLSDILLYLDRHPEIAEKNKLIVQKQAKD